MLRNCFKVSLSGHLFAVLNTVGLGISIATCITLSLDIREDVNNRSSASFNTAIPSGQAAAVIPGKCHFSQHSQLASARIAAPKRYQHCACFAS
ncbi:hypothetical protein [Pontibacter sp. SGAir0037]|uniref:hypothetical protein n=1 Tax=Pontibacter sp. SGAir0037 TaxID=2571030 RepID=UPI0010CD189B|nr:hypothetical protein [Pontibacter sp. SGAir0037]QCR21264.1 hypothetical protein C1N53_02130 [Pontibacter sp. SGAir0037]